MQIARNLPFSGNIFSISVSCPTRHGPAISLQVRVDILYIREKTVSIMNLVKSKYRSIFTDHLKNLLIPATSSVNPNNE